MSLVVPTAYISSWQRLPLSLRRCLSLGPVACIPSEELLHCQILMLGTQMCSDACACTQDFGCFFAGSNRWTDETAHAPKAQDSRGALSG
eukprot:1160736-Pelagomonas_calceolata.AAC.9